MRPIGLKLLTLLAALALLALLAWPRAGTPARARAQDAPAEPPPAEAPATAPAEPADEVPATAPAEPTTAPAEPTSAPALGADAHSLFFPTRSAGPGAVVRSAPVEPPPRPVLREFVLSAVVRGPSEDRVLLQLRNPEETRWVRPGESVAGCELVGVDDTGASFALAGEPSRLEVGQSSLLLARGRRVHSFDGLVLAVCQSPIRSFALVQLPDRTEPVQIVVGDALPGGVVAGIEPGQLVLQRDGLSRSVAVGQSTAQEARP